MKTIKPELKLKTLKTIEEDWENELTETLVEPLAKIGFNLKSYSGQHQKHGVAGVYTLIFEHDNETDFRDSWIENLMTEAENRPQAVYQRSLDILWVFLPYTM